MKTLIAGLVLLGASCAVYADGTRQQYDQAIVNRMALDPNEALVNDDGAVENPNARMSGTARAFRNGVLQGRNMQRQEDESSDNPPPLPPVTPETQRAARAVAQDDQSTYTTIPPQPRAYRRYPAPVKRSQYGQVQSDSGYYGGYNERPIAPPVNVYVQPPQTPYYVQQAPAYDEPQEPYLPPPGPPPSTYVVVQNAPPALATGYWPRGYRPMYTQPAYQAPIIAPYVGFTLRYRGRW